MKKILILTAGSGEGHNSATRDIRQGFAQVAGADARVEVHDLFAHTYGLANDYGRELSTAFATCLAVSNRMRSFPFTRPARICSMKFSAQRTDAKANAS